MRVGPIVRAILVLAGVLWLMASAAAHAAYPGSNGKIAFARGGQIWTVNPDGTGEVQLTSDAAPSYDPEWSPNGTRIMYTRGNSGERQVRVMNADGTGDTPVASELAFGYEWFSPTWSPDGSRIASVRRHEDWHACDGCLLDDFRLSDPDGSRKEPHSSEPAYPVAGLEWSPKGDELIYSTGSDGNEMKLEIDGVTGGPAQTFVTGGFSYDLYSPKWSPDAQKVAYLRQEVTYVEPPELYVRDRDGSGLTQVMVGEQYGFEWSPDGTKLVVANGADLFIVDADGTNEVPLGLSSGFEGQPDWQPLPGALYPGYTRPKGATPFFIPLVPAYESCTSPDRSHGPPLAFGSCSAPSQSSSRLTVGTPDANGAAANASGHLLLDVSVGNSSTLAIEADVFIGFSLTDVRCTVGVQSPFCGPANAQGGADYTAYLGGVLWLRSTDRYNLPSRAGREPGTLSDTSVEFRPDCFATSDTARGGTCRLSTSGNALMPGLVAEGRRANWEIGAVRVHDDIPASAGAVFATQGVFVP